jgi:hypothetical protein
VRRRVGLKAHGLENCKEQSVPGDHAKIGCEKSKRECDSARAQIDGYLHHLNCISAGWAVREKHSSWAALEDIGGRSTQECLANSGANLFAAADLTLMRSAPKNAVKNERIQGQLWYLLGCAETARLIFIIPPSVGVNIKAQERAVRIGCSGCKVASLPSAHKKDAARSPQAPSSSRRVLRRTSPQRCDSK